MMGGHSWTDKVAKVDMVAASHINDLQDDKADNKYGITEKTADYTLTTADLLSDNVFKMNSADDKTFTLPSVGASDVGLSVILAKVGAGKLTIQAADSDTINDSSGGGTLYNDQSGETYAVAKLILISTTKWIAFLIGAGWITT